MARLEFLENEIAAKEARIMELRRRRKPTMSPKADGDFVPTLPSCEDDSTPDLTQMWIDACQIAQNYQNLNYKIINFQEAVNNQISEDMSKSELVPLAVRQLKNKFSTLQVGVQTLSSKERLKPFVNPYRPYRYCERTNVFNTMKGNLWIWRE